MANRQKTEIQVNNHWKVVRIDSLNWCVYEYREGVKDGENVTDWFTASHYFGQLAPALRWIADEQISDSGEKYDLMQAVSAIETSNLKLAKDIREVLKNASVD